MNNQLPCPFCGSKSVKIVKKRARYKGVPSYIASVRCNVCHARGGTIINVTIPYAVKEDVEALAWERWNRRSFEPETVDEDIPAETNKVVEEFNRDVEKISDVLSFIDRQSS